MPIKRVEAAALYKIKIDGRINNMLVEIMKFGREERVAVTSLDVAETFGKAHDKVMRDIKELGCSKEFNAANFGGITYLDSRGRTQKAYVMTRDGFTLLVMGYTGELAMKFKESYIMAAMVQGELLTLKILETHTLEDDETNYS